MTTELFHTKILQQNSKALNIISKVFLRNAFGFVGTQNSLMKGFIVRKRNKTAGEMVTGQDVFEYLESDVDFMSRAEIVTGGKFNVVASKCDFSGIDVFWYVLWLKDAVLTFKISKEYFNVLPYLSQVNVNGKTFANVTISNYTIAEHIECFFVKDFSYDEVFNILNS